MTTVRPLRADARRNRERVLDAARTVLASEGLEASMSEIAERAGVGVGTLYRHFPTKEALVQALMLDHLEAIVDEVDAAAREEPDPWHAFVRVLRLLAGLKAKDQCLAEVWEGRGLVVGDELMRAEQAAFGAIGGLMRRAQEAGSLRADLAPGDLPLLLAGLGATVWLHGERGRELSDRYLTIVIDGLQAPGATKLPHRALSKRELRALFRSPGDELPARSSQVEAE